MTDNKERAQACPFCGGTENLLSSNGVASHYVFCNSYDCGAEGPVRETEDGAISAWNARSALAASQEKAEPFAWYSAKVNDVITDAKKASRAKVQPWDAQHYDRPLYTAPAAAQASEPDGAYLLQIIQECAPAVGLVPNKASAEEILHLLRNAAPQPSAEAVREAREAARRIHEWLANHGRENTVSLLLLQATKAIEAVVLDARQCRGDPGECAYHSACMYACGAPPQPAEQPTALSAALTDEEIIALAKAWRCSHPGSNDWFEFDSHADLIDYVRTMLARAQGEQA